MYSMPTRRAGTPIATGPADTCLVPTHNPLPTAYSNLGSSNSAAQDKLAAEKKGQTASKPSQSPVLDALMSSKSAASRALIGDNGKVGRGAMSGHNGLRGTAPAARQVAPSQTRLITG